VHSFLALLAESGFARAPRVHGLDECGREVLDYLPGWVPPDLEWRRWEDAQLVEAAQVVRSLHDASSGSTLAGSAETVCHGDLSPCNFVFVDGRPRCLIDFDRAHPDSRRSDLAYMAWAWLVGNEDPTRSTPLRHRLRQLRLVLDTYRLAEREEFAAAIQDKQREVLANHERHENAVAADWVRTEIDFVETHAREINDAAASSFA
jgi:aminoglycoside phosphotransferase (APT) family kinase protein